MGTTDKLDYNSTEATFLGCQRNNIDGAVGKFYAVGSESGEIRLYNKVGGNAKNLLPSLFGNNIVSLDSTKNGDFLLAATRSFIMLIPTLQNGKNGFDFTFRKSAKPQPIILKVSPRAMRDHQIDHFCFTSVKFDNRKEGHEGMIVATSGSHVMIWSLKAVVRGKTETSLVKSYDEEIVGNDFRFNSNMMVNALKKKVVVQDSSFRY